MRYKYTHKRSPLTLDETNRITNSCHTIKEKIVIWGILDTGLRVDELCHISLSNIDWQRGRITTYGKGDSFLGAKGKHEKKKRVVPMPHRFKRLLEAHFATANTEDGNLTTLRDTLRLTKRTAEMIVKKVANRAMIGKSCCPHVLRHTFAMRSLENGVPLPALQVVMGHEDLATTAIYLNASPDESIRMYQERGFD